MAIEFAKFNAGCFCKLSECKGRSADSRGVRFRPADQSKMYQNRAVTETATMVKVHYQCHSSLVYYWLQNGKPADHV